MGKCHSKITIKRVVNIYDIIYNKDLLFYLSDFLKDDDSINLFLINKYTCNLFCLYSNRYNVKKEVSFLDKYRVKRYVHNQKDLITFPNLLSIRFGDDFNKLIPIYPLGLEELYFGDSFNQYVSSFPKTLKKLVFGKKFNQNIKEYPPELKYLKFGELYNQPIIIKLPDTLEHLKYGYNFNQNVNGKLPPSLIYLEFGKLFNHNIEEIPDRLERIVFSSNSQMPFNDFRVIKKIEIDRENNKLILITKI